MQACNGLKPPEKKESMTHQAEAAVVFEEELKANKGYVCVCENNKRAPLRNIKGVEMRERGRGGEEA